MSADLLREAAKVLRERTARYGVTVQQCVDLPLADWLDDAAARRYHTPTGTDAALKVARAILGHTVPS